MIRLVVVEGDASAVKVYDSESYQPVGEIKVSIDADSIAYDAATHHLYVVSGGREAHTPYSLISVIDADNSKKLRDIKINTNHVEAIVLEKSGPRMFCNLTGLSAVGVMDRNKSTLDATWPLPAGDKLNVAMAFDEANHRLFVVTRNPGKLIALNSDRSASTSRVTVPWMSSNRRMQTITLCWRKFPELFAPRRGFWSRSCIATILPSRTTKTKMLK